MGGVGEGIERGLLNLLLYTHGLRVQYSGSLIVISFSVDT